MTKQRITLLILFTVGNLALLHHLINYNSRVSSTPKLIEDGALSIATIDSNKEIYTKSNSDDCWIYATEAIGVVRNGVASNGSTTEVGSSKDFLTLSLPDQVPAGTNYNIYMNSNSGATTTNVWEAPSGTTLPNLATPPSSENCTNNIDDDNDGLIDSFDPDCACKNGIPNIDFSKDTNCLLYTSPSPRD